MAEGKGFRTKRVELVAGREVPEVVACRAAILTAEAVFVQIDIWSAR